MEIMFDLDEEAAEACANAGIEMARVPTVGTDPQFVSMLTELIRERLDPAVAGARSNLAQSSRRRRGPAVPQRDLLS